MTRHLILVIEDNLAIAELLEDVLRDHGFQTMLAQTAEAAVGFLETVRPALITLDLGLPDMNDRRLLRLLRERPATTTIIVVIVSAEHFLEQDVQALARAVVTKPFAIPALIETITRLLLPPLDVPV